MEETRCLALLLCDGASRAANGKINLHGIFDRIQVKIDSGRPDRVVASEKPDHLNSPTPLFFVFYKVKVIEPCTLRLVVEDPEGKPIKGPWQDEIADPGVIQTVWCLNLDDFAVAGTYKLRLMSGHQMLSETSLEVSPAAGQETESESPEVAVY
jgi:hypothetical protein